VNRRRAEQQGRKGEGLAAWYLRLKGWRIVARRVKTPRGEIDLIARRGRTLAMVEVKWRRSENTLSQAIDDSRLRRVVAAAEAVAHRWLRPGDCLRVDVILLAPRRWPHHMVNVSIS